MARAARRPARGWCTDARRWWAIAASWARRGLDVLRLGAEILGGEPRVDLDEVAVGIPEPEWRAAPCSCYRCAVVRWAWLGGWRPLAVVLSGWTAATACSPDGLVPVTDPTTTSEGPTPGADTGATSSSETSATPDVTSTTASTETAVPADGSDTAADSDTGEVLPDPPNALLVSEVAAAGGWFYLTAPAPLETVVLSLDGVELGAPDEALNVDFPVGVWRVPADTPLGVRTLSLGWADAPQAASTYPLMVVAPSFEDIAEPTGLAQTHDVTGADPECAQSHTGLAMGDYDGDGLPDLYVGHVGGDGGRLHRNLGPQGLGGLPGFADVTDAAGLAGVDAVAMATFIDLDGDSDLDLFIGRRGTNRMFENRLVEDGAATFVDITDAAGLGLDSQRTMGVAFGDYDGDDDLDLYVVNHAWCFPVLGSEIRAEDHLYRNDGGVFVERSSDMAPVVGPSVGFSAAWIDIERDGDQDLIVINDDVGGEIGDPNEVWRNDGPGGAGGWTFTDVSASSGVRIHAVNGMGLALGDVDGDGLVDLAFTNIGANVLMLNTGGGVFENVSKVAGIERAMSPWERPSVTWAAHLWDHDNDGDLDLYFSGGPITANVPSVDAFFENLGDVTFTERTWTSALADPASGKGSLIGDLDGDGAWDIVTAAWGGPLRVWRNVAVPADHHFVDVALVGRGGNRAALGAIVELDTAAGVQTCFHTQRPALGAGGETACHFGLGTDSDVGELQITWADGSVQNVGVPPVDARVVYTQPQG